MPNQLFANPFPYGSDITQKYQHILGSLALAGSAVATGEPLDWTKIISGIGFNDKNFAGNGVAGNGSALTTGFAVSAGVCTVTADNNFSAGQQVTFYGNTQTLSALFNFTTVAIASADATTFTFTTAQTGVTTTGDVGLAVSGNKFLTLGLNRPTITAPVTSLAVTSASGGVPAFITVTAANNYLPGATVTFAGLGTDLGLLMNGVTFTVVKSIGTTFTVYSTLTGSAGSDTGTASGQNPCVPFSVRFWSAIESGYTYQYNSTTGNLFVMQVPAAADLTDAAPLSALPAAAYPAGVLADVIKYEAYIAKDR